MAGTYDEQLKALDEAEAELEAELESELDDEPDDAELDDDEPEPLDGDEVESIVNRMVEDAVNFVDTELSPLRAKAMSYYKGEGFGDEVEGRSQYVSTDVRDTILSLLPDLMRVFTGPEHVAEFQPQSADDEDVARLQTLYINHIFLKDNPGFLRLYGALKDAMRAKLGVLTWGWQQRALVEHYTLDGVSEEQLLLLQQEPGVTVEVTGQYTLPVPPELAPPPPLPPPATEGQPPAPEGQPPMPGPGGTGQPPEPPTLTLYRVRVQRVDLTGKAVISAVPPEEFLIERNATDPLTALFMGRRMEMRRSDVLQLGLADEEQLESVGAGTSSLSDNEERAARAINQNTLPSETGGDRSAELVDVVTGHAYIDRNQDGEAEHYDVVLVGKVLTRVEPSAPEDRPFALFCPDPEPHLIIGGSIADLTMDLQYFKSKVIRNMADSLAFSIHPRTAVLDGKANMADVLNTEVGGIVREYVPNAVRPLDHPFVGAAAFPVLEYIDTVKQDRTGVSRAAAGLNPDALQSSTKAAVAATVTAAQRHVELLARVFAETGLQQLFRGLLRLVVRHQDKPRQLRLGGAYVVVDPRPWVADLDLDINIPASIGSDDDKMQQLLAIAAKQEQAIQLMGPQNPLVGVGQYATTLRKMVELSGWPNTAQFFTPLPPTYQPPPPPPPKPTPEEIYAQVEQLKVQASIAREGAALQLEREKVYLTDDRERDKNEMQAFLQAAELSAKYKLEEDKMTAKMRELVDRQRQNAAMQRGGMGG